MSNFFQTTYLFVSLNLVSSLAKAVKAYDFVTVLVKLLGSIRSKRSIIFDSSTFKQEPIRTALKKVDEKNSKDVKRKQIFFINKVLQ